MDEDLEQSSTLTSESVRSDSAQEDEDNTKSSSERQRRHRRRRKEEEDNNTKDKDKKTPSERRRKERPPGEGRKDSKERSEDHKRRHRRPKDSSTTSSGEGSLSSSREPRKGPLRGGSEHRVRSTTLSVDSSEASTSSGDKNPTNTLSPSTCGLSLSSPISRVRLISVSADSSMEVPIPGHRAYRRPSSSLGRIPDESRENDVGFVGVKGSISSGLLVPRRMGGRIGSGSLDSSDLGGIMREAPESEPSSPIGIGTRIGAENVPMRPQVRYGRRNSEGTYNFDEQIPRKPKIHKSGSGEWNSLSQRSSSEDLEYSLPKSEPNTPVSPPILDLLSKRRNSDGNGTGFKKQDSLSPRHLGPLTELEVVDEDSNEGGNEHNEEGNEDKNRPKKRRISSCSSGAGKTLIVVKTTPPSQRRRGMSSSGPALGIASGTTGASGSGSGSGSASGSGSGSSGGGVCPIIGTASCGSHSPPPSLNLQVLNDANRPKLLPNKVYFLGKPGSGKSSLIQVMATGAFGVLDRYNKREKVVRVKLTRSRTDPQYVDVVDTTYPFEPYLLRPDPKCFVFVYNVTDADSMKYTEHLISSFLNVFSSGTAPPCLLVGTKIDLVPEVPRAVPLEKGLAVAAGLKALHMEVSSRTSSNISSLKQLIYTTLQSPLSPKKSVRPKSVPRSNPSLSSSGGSSRSSSSPPSPSSSQTNNSIFLKPDGANRNPRASDTTTSISSSASSSLSISESISTDSISDSISDSIVDYKPPTISLIVYPTHSSVLRGHGSSPSLLSSKSTEIATTAISSPISFDVITSDPSKTYLLHESHKILPHKRQQLHQTRQLRQQEQQLQQEEQQQPQQQKEQQEQQQQSEKILTPKVNGTIADNIDLSGMERKDSPDQVDVTTEKL